MDDKMEQYIRSTIQQSDFSDEYLDEFIELLEAAPKEDFHQFISLFKRDTTFLELLYKSYAGKKRALKQGSEEALQEVLEEEYRILKMIEAQGSDEQENDYDIPNNES